MLNTGLQKSTASSQAKPSTTEIPVKIPLANVRSSKSANQQTQRQSLASVVELQLGTTGFGFYDCACKLDNGYFTCS